MRESREVLGNVSGFVKAKVCVGQEYGQQLQFVLVMFLMFLVGYTGITTEEAS